MSATVKDNAGVPPIHLAAFKGHADVVDYLIRYVLFRNRMACIVHSLQIFFTPLTLYGVNLP